MSLAGKVVVITGAASGIGRALALEAAERGARLALCDVDEAGLAEVAARTGALSRRVDVREEAAILELAAAVDRELGGASVVFNNAGVSLSATVGAMSREDFVRVMDINFWGVVRGTEAFLPQLRRAPEAHLVNVASVFGIIGVPSQAAYCSSKFAVRGFTESLAHELRGTSVRVSVVCPGGVKTDIVRRGKHVIDARGESTTKEAAAREFDALARTSPEDAAKRIWRGVLAGERRILVGADARAIDLIARTAPEGYGAVVDVVRRRR